MKQLKKLTVRRPGFSHRERLAKKAGLRQVFLSLFLIIFSQMLKAQPNDSCINCDGNMILNADFMHPVCNFGVSSNMSYVNCSSPTSGLAKANYTFATSASSWNGSWSASDPFMPGGKFMLGKGPDMLNSSSEQIAWKQTVNVSADSDYCFSVMLRNPSNEPVRPSFQLKINGLTGVTVASLNNLSYSSGWVKLQGYYTATSTGSIELDLLVIQQNGPGNIFAADNFSFKPRKLHAWYRHGPLKCNEGVQFDWDENIPACHKWDFGDGGTSNLEDPFHQFPGVTGEYRVKHIVWDCCDADTFETLIKILCPCDCDGCDSNANRNGDLEMKFFCASMNDSQNMYGSNLGFRCFDSIQPLYSGHFTTPKDANNWNPGWYGRDNSTYNGQFILGDGTDTPSVVYHSLPMVDSGRTYCFSAMVKNVCKACPGRPSFELRLNSPTGTLVGGIDTVAFDSVPGNWIRICGRFKATATTVMPLYVINYGPTANGNDFGLDDIEIRAIDTPSAEFTWIPGGICKSPIQFLHKQYTSGRKHKNSSSPYHWDFGDGTTSTERSPLHIYDAPGIYTVRHIIANDCGRDTVWKQITVGRCCSCEPCGNASIATNGNFNDTSCVNIPFTTQMIRRCDSATLDTFGYALTTNASFYNAGWIATDRNGNSSSGILIGDGPDSIQGKKLVWRQVKSTTIGRKFCFIAWVKNLCSETWKTSPGFELWIGNKRVDVIEAVLFSSGWVKLCGTFTATSPLGNFQLFVMGKNGIGNDFAVDDIGIFDISPKNPAFNAPLSALICNNLLTFTLQSFPDTAGTHFWDFGDGSTSNLAHPKHKYLTADTFQVMHVVTNNCGSDTFYRTLIIGLCNCACEGCDSAWAERVINGDFSLNRYNGQGDTAYSSDLSYSNGPQLHNYHTVSDSAGFFDSGWEGMDHTGNGSRFLMGDMTEGQGHQRVWKQKVKVKKDALYCFSAWVKNIKVNNQFAHPDFQLRVYGINGKLVAARDNVNYQEGWVKMCGYFVAEANDSIEISIVVKDSSAAGNDFAVDDISFKPVNCDTCTCPHPKWSPSNSEFELLPEEQETVIYYPVPLRQGESLQLDYVALTASPISISIIDVSGRVVMSSQARLVQGNNHISLGTGSLPAGIYFIQTETNSATHTYKIIVRAE